MILFRINCNLAGIFLKSKVASQLIKTLGTVICRSLVVNYSGSTILRGSSEEIRLRASFLAVLLEWEAVKG